MSIEKKSSDALLFVKNGTKVVRAVSTSDMQVGTASQPAELQVTGRFTQSLTVVPVDPGKTVTLSENSSTIVGVKIGKGTGHVNVVLPVSPREGQTIYVKDVSGKSAINNIVVRCANSKFTIDGVESKTINSNYDSVTFVWSEDGWLSIGGNSTVIGPQGPVTAVFTFTAAGYSNDDDPSATEYNGFLYPAASLEKPLGYVSDPAPAETVIGVPVPFGGKITAVSVSQALSEALPTDITYRLYVNGNYASLPTKATVKFPKSVLGKTGTWTGEISVKAGDIISVVETQSNPGINGDSLIEALGGLTYLSVCVVLTKS